MKSREELANLLKQCLENGDIDGVWFVIGELEKGESEAYKEGAADVLSYLEGVYGEGIHATDVWAEYMGACDCCTGEEEEGAE